MSYEPVAPRDGAAPLAEAGGLPDAAPIDAIAPIDVRPMDAGSDARLSCTDCTTVSVAAGRDHTCALVSTGEVYCWGRNGDRQLGTGASADRVEVPAPVVGLHDAIAITAGEWHTCAIRAGGTVVCWGDNSVGQIGDGTILDAPEPVEVAMASGATAISAGHGHTCATTSGSIVCWGDNARGQLGESPVTLPRGTVTLMGVDALAISAGGVHTCALDVSAAVSCWGANDSGQLGDGTLDDRHTPRTLRAVGRTVVAISAGGAHACAVLTTGSALCWGNNASGQLGDGTTGDRSTAADVLDIFDASAISAGDSHTCAIVGDGVRCWGRNEGGELGDGTWLSSPTPVVTRGIAAALHVDVDWFHSVALLPDGAVVAWGDNRWGQIGDGTLETRPTPVFVSVP